MFRKIVLTSVAALGLVATTVAPIDAHPSRGHARPVAHVNHYRPYVHREFGCWADANAWIRVQRSHGLECYYEWHGPNCWVFYR